MTCPGLFTVLRELCPAHPVPRSCDHRLEVWILNSCCPWSSVNPSLLKSSGRGLCGYFRRHQLNHAVGIYTRHDLQRGSNRLGRSVFSTASRQPGLESTMPLDDLPCVRRFLGIRYLDWGSPAYRTRDHSWLPILHPFMIAARERQIAPCSEALRSVCGFASISPLEPEQSDLCQA